MPFDPLALRTLEDPDGADQPAAVAGVSADDDSSDDDAAAAADAKAATKAPRKKKAKEVNPSFSFSLADALPAPLGAAGWDFSSSKQALAVRAALKASGKTSIDEKISRTLSELPASFAADAAALKESGAGTGDDDAASEGQDSDGEDSDGEPGTARRRAAHKEEDEPEDIVRDKRKAEFFDMAEEERAADDTADSFHALQLSRPVLKSIAALGFVRPTEIQSRAIPLALQGRDICGSAVTGSGKTAAFMIPTIERLLFRPKNAAMTRVLVLVPTRELGVQCQSVAVNLAKFTDITVCLCVGGLPVKAQEAELKLRPDIVIATPGRLIDHIHNSQSFSLDTIEIMVIDEADRILDDGFEAELNEIIKHTPKTRQTMLFSATMTDNVDDLIKLSLNRPVRLFVDSSTSLTNRLVQEFIRVRNTKEESRPAILAALCSRTYTSETIIFFRSKAAAHHMKIVFGLLGLKAAELHGNLSQLQRLEAIELFRSRKVGFLLATDLASRGLDIQGVKTVINYDMPSSYSVYVHRVGRTARGGSGGRAVSLVGEADRALLKMAIKNTRDAVKNRIVPADVITKYEGMIAQLKDAIKQIYAEEKEERELSTAEMEVKRAENLIHHRDEIMSRPARTWFQSEKERSDAKVAAPDQPNKSDDKRQNAAKPKKRQHGDDDGDDSDGKKSSTRGLSRKKCRLREAREEDKQAQASMMRAAKSSKTAKRPKKITALPSKPASAGGRKGSSFNSEMRGAGKKRRK
ncbi:nucleolar DEAD-box protein required for synthesis of 60S ribosomal subunit [Polyrhizophydium stewartii]|uniref:RNA helicase n=1 Tax=Polyrhizophydium stewartii TaxID=2732419 RepID=A0ABR4N0B8_9FUNG|nr:nucleolar DEAD-box protein required for synthesis of 60S ribosomal subunit [Polyrhizophydium stewartii]